MMCDYDSPCERRVKELDRELASMTMRRDSAEESARIAIARADAAEKELADVLRTLGTVYLEAVRRRA